jgi:hypothetical protein
LHKNIIHFQSVTCYGKRKKTSKIMHSFREYLASAMFHGLACCSVRDFTRERKCSFTDIVMFQSRGLSHGVVNEHRQITTLLEAVRGSASEQDSFSEATPQAISKARKKITPEAYQLLSRHLVQDFYADDDIQLWREKWRLLAVDGTTLQLPSSNECIAAFGVIAPSSFPLGRLSVVYDVRNRFVLDTILSSYEDDERSLAMRHLEVFDLDRENRPWCNLLLADMNYPCFYLMQALILRGDDLLFRYSATGACCIAEVSDALAQAQTDTVLEIDLCKAGRAINHRLKPILEQMQREGRSSILRLRLVVLTLANGTREVLLTSLLEPSITIEDFRELYNERWGVETYYDVLKNVLVIERFSSPSFQGIMQDIYAAELLANFLALALYDAQEELTAYNQAAERKYQYIINTTQSVSILRQRIVQMLVFQRDEEIPRILSELRRALLRNIVPRRPNRPQTNPQRKKKHKHKKHSLNEKRVV